MYSNRYLGIETSNFGTKLKTKVGHFIENMNTISNPFLITELTF